MTDVLSLAPALLEQSEAAAFADVEAAASAAVRTALGMRQARVGGGVALAVPGDPSGFWSRTLGLGFTEPVTAGLLDRVVEFYRGCGLAAAILQIAPQVLPPDWADMRTALNISDTGVTVAKLAGDVRTVATRGYAAARLDDGLRVAQVPVDRARDWAEVVVGVFGLPTAPPMEMVVRTVRRPGWRTFAVFDGADIVATAALHISGSTGQLFGGATLPAARRRGAQSALIAARAAAARKAGCAWLVGETGAERPGEHNPSLHNMLRAGMGICYERQNWTLHT